LCESIVWELLYLRMVTGIKAHLRMEDHAVTEPWSTRIVSKGSMALLKKLPMKASGREVGETAEAR